MFHCPWCLGETAFPGLCEPCLSCPGCGIRNEGRVCETCFRKVMADFEPAPSEPVFVVDGSAPMSLSVVLSRYKSVSKERLLDIEPGSTRVFGDGPNPRPGPEAIVVTRFHESFDF